MTPATGFRRLLAPGLLLVLFMVLLPGIPGPAGASPAVEEIRSSSTRERTRVVLDLSRAVRYSHRPLADPPRIVVEIPGARLTGKARPREIGDGYVHRVRTNTLRGGRVQVVLDLGRMLDYSIFTLKNPDRIVVDVTHQGAPVPASPPPGADKPGDSAPGARELDRQERPPVTLPRQTRQGPYVVAIDAGHGGEDAGATHHRTREKDITLALARELAHELEKRPGIRPFLVRKGDYYIPLRKRWDLAEGAKADLFISIHCNASEKSSAKGTEVYFLSLKGASSVAAQELARRENEVDVKMGVVPEDDLLTGIVNDMIQTDVLQKSEYLAETCLANLVGLGTVYDRGVKQAGFEVLKSPRMPSILVEAAFISNRRENRLLRDDGWQRIFGRKLADGVELYLRDVIRAEE